MIAAPTDMLVIATHSVRDRQNTPRRHLDVLPLPAGAEPVVGEWFDSDEDVQTRFHERPLFQLQRLYAGLKLLLQHREALQRSRFIYCLDSSHFNWLLLLSRTPLFSPKGKVIRRFAFRDRAIRRLSPLLSRSASGFQVDYITPEQVDRANAAVHGDRVRLHPWRIDTDWYTPDPSAMPDRHHLLAGNMFRDESLIRPLLQSGAPVRRLGRHSSLTERFRDLDTHPDFSLVVNASHRDYLMHLQASPSILLPILPCDEPAGLTAAMEAVACGVPVLANRSMGIADLFDTCDYPLPLVPDLDPSSWVGAIRELAQRRKDPGFLPQLLRARERLIDRRGIRPGAQDWEQLFQEALA